MSIKAEVGLADGQRQLVADDRNQVIIQRNSLVLVIFCMTGIMAVFLTNCGLGFVLLTCWQRAKHYDVITPAYEMHLTTFPKSSFEE